MPRNRAVALPVQVTEWRILAQESAPITMAGPPDAEEMPGAEVCEVGDCAPELCPSNLAGRDAVNTIVVPPMPADVPSPDFLCSDSELSRELFHFDSPPPCPSLPHMDL